MEQPWRFTHMNNDARPYLRIRIKDRWITGLVDTGAQVSVVGRKFIPMINSLDLEVSWTQGESVQTVDSTSHDITSVVELPIVIAGDLRNFRVRIVESFDQFLVLGMDFINEFGLSINFGVGGMGGDRTGCSGGQLALVSHEELSPGQLVEVERIKNQLVELSKPSEDGTLRSTAVMRHQIILKPGTLPIKQRVRPVSAPVQQALGEQLDELISMGVVEPSCSPWCNPLVLQTKKDGSLRFCLDARRVNDVTVTDSYPVPHMVGILDMLKSARYVSSIDLKSAFFQLELEELSRPVTAFVVPRRGLWQFRRMPFGLKNSGATFQRLIESVIGHDLQPHCFSYLDDLVVATETWEDHVRVLSEVIDRLRNANLTVNYEKCELFKSKLVYLGFVVGPNGLEACQDKVKAIAEFPRLNSQREVRRFLGLASYYRRFVPGFSKTAGPLSNLLRKNQRFIWTLDCERAFAELKEKLTTSPVLAMPDYSLPFTVQTDASLLGLGAVLTQQFPEGERVIAYASRSLSSAERKFSVIELECLAVLWAIKHWRQYLELTEFTVITDQQALKWLNELKEPSPRLARWAIELQSHNYHIVYRKGKYNRADALSRAPIEVEVNTLDFQAETADRWFVDMRRKIVQNPDQYPLWRVEGDSVMKYVPGRDDLVPSWKLLVPRGQRQKLMEENHNTPHSGHFGVYKTLNRLAEDYYWPKMRRDVQRFVAQCRICCAFKAPNTRQHGLMGRHIVSEPWQLLAVDISGPYPGSPRRNKFLLSVQDVFSKFLLIFPMTDSTAAKVSKILDEQVFDLFGVPRSIICDNGSQFTSREFVNLMEARAIKIRHTALYHAQADPVERAHRELKRMMASFMSTRSHGRWDEHLSRFRLALNTSVSLATGFAPSSVLLGYRVKPNNRELQGEDYNELGEPDEHVRRNLERWQDIKDQTKKMLDKQFLRNQKQYDAKRKDLQLSIGDLVWRRNYVKSSAVDKLTKKLAPKFVGPRRVVARHGHNVYELQNLDGVADGQWHVKDLFPDRTLDGVNSEVDDQEAGSDGGDEWQ
ncbi:hypothetical protein GE061_009312 [Apolygus lucorum]|uniref:RNA-directed DNA polymerase n=1 Tax=Apolygus lucorum TaxID=248454 RepID=A0A6A4JU45_APOLU|nr:hypothetical protein GE061_009312 [Apolygus lucorum]